MPFRYGNKILLFIKLAIFLILISGVILSWFTYISTTAKREEFLKQRAQVVATVFSPEQISRLDGSSQDLGSQAYQTVKSLLQHIRKVNSDIRFVYIMGKSEQGEIFFYADSETAGSPDESPPGQVYTEISPDEKVAIINKQTTLTKYSDRWGKWVTAVAPVYDSENLYPSLTASVGMDIPLDALYREGFYLASLPLVFSLGISAILFAFYKISRKEEEYVQMKSEYMSIAAHDLRTPLTGINWITELMLLPKASPLTNEQKTKILDIRKSAANLLATVGDLLNAASLESGKHGELKKQNTKLKDCLDNALAPLDLAIQEQDLTIKFEGDWSQSTVAADIDKLRRVFANLLSNAIKYSKKSGILTITLLSKEDHWQVKISDQGIGIPHDEISKIFDGYYRASNAKLAAAAGTGLGLYYVRYAVEQHGGKVWAKSTLGKGTSMFVELPKA